MIIASPIKINAGTHQRDTNIRVPPPFLFYEFIVELLIKTDFTTIY